MNGMLNNLPIVIREDDRMNRTVIESHLNTSNLYRIAMDSRGIKSEMSHIVDYGLYTYKYNDDLHDKKFNIFMEGVRDKRIDIPEFSKLEIKTVVINFDNL